MRLFILYLMLAVAPTAVTPQDSGLKKVNFDQATSDMNPETPTAGSATGPALSPEAQAKLLEELKIIKERQEESRKALEELEKEE